MREGGPVHGTREGSKIVFQLDGGILKYFEECGGAHYDGECFVFDQRVGLDPSLQETESTQCFRCQTPLSEEEQKDARYVAGQSCPYCFKTPAEQMASVITQRQATIARVMSPLPGSVPYDQFKPVNVPEDCDGKTLLETLCRIVSHISVEHWRAECERGLVVDMKGVPVSADKIVRAGECYRHKFPNITEPAVNPRVEILHEDEALIVLNKPAPLPMHAGGRFFRNTLQHILNEVYHPQKPHPAHRLDANTTGVVLVTRTRHFAGKLQPQFAKRQIEKCYLVWVQGQPTEEMFHCDAPISAEAGELGSRAVDFAGAGGAHGIPGVTAECGWHGVTGSVAADGSHETRSASTARTLGFPVCGDPAYLGGREIRQPADAGSGRSAAMFACMENRVHASVDAGAHGVFRPAAGMGQLIT